MSIIAVIGPVGSGKYAQAVSIAAGRPDYVVSSIQDEWKVLHKRGFTDSRRTAKTIVATNGGSIFFHKECKARRLRPIHAVHAPADMVALVQRIVRHPFFARNSDMCHEDFIGTEFFRQSLSMFREPGGPGYAAHQRMVAQAATQTRQACSQRVESGEYTLGGQGGEPGKCFATAEAMHARMEKVTRRNLKSQFALALWAHQVGRKLVGYTAQ